MKRTILLLIIISMLSLSISGCFGSFAITKTVYNFNKNLENKFVRSIVMWAFYIVPVYPLSTWVDVFILNVIEFWTDSNPMAMEQGEFEKRFYSFKDQNYEVITSHNRYDIINTNTQETFNFFFDENSNCWFSENEGIVYKLTEQDENNVYIFHPNGDLLFTKNLNN